MLVVMLALLLVAIAVGFGWWLRRDGAVEVRVLTVGERQRAAGATVLNASGYVTARRRATVSSKITGKLTHVRVEEGLSVKQGEEVARLDDSRYRANLELAESRLAAARKVVEETRARLKLAQLTLDRSQKLVGDGISQPAELDAARADVDAYGARLALEQEQVVVAEREAALRRVELADTVIHAPFDGVVISKDAQAGEMVSPVSAGGGFTRTGICTLVDMTSLEIEVDVNESYIRRVRPEQPVEAVLDAYPDWKISCRVITTVPAADRQKATVLVRIRFDMLDPRILPDMGVKVAFLESARAADATPTARPRIFLPPSAVRQHEGRDCVYVVNGDRAERRMIRTGGGSSEEVEVIAGLTAGEKVVVEGPGELADGDRIKQR